MQTINSTIMDEARKEKIKQLEQQLQWVSEVVPGELILCPFCKYESKKNRKGTAKVFENEWGRSFKCFACGIWRKI